MSATDDLLRAVGLTPGPPGPKGEAWSYTLPAGKAPACPDCGSPVQIGFDLRAAIPHTIVTHPLPVCPGFARRLEDLEE